MPRPTCKHEDCDMKALTRGYCRKHYDLLRASGKLEMVGTGSKGGRPAGPVLASDPPKGWEEGPEVPVSELHSLVRKWARHVLTDPGAAVMERTAAARIAAGMENTGGDKEKLDRLSKLMGQTLRAVPDGE